MSLKNKITQIAQEVATQVVGAVFNNSTANNGVSICTITGMSTDSSGNRVITVQTSTGVSLSNIPLASNRPLGVGDTVTVTNASGSQIAQ